MMSETVENYCWCKQAPKDQYLSLHGAGTKATPVMAALTARADSYEAACANMRIATLLLDAGAQIELPSQVATLPKSTLLVKN